MIISGIPFAPKEDLREVARILAEFLGVNLKEHHFRAIHRLPATSEDRPPPIILVVNDIDVKYNMIRGAKLKKPTGANFGVDDFPIYVDEHLTKPTVELLLAAKELQKKKKIHSVSCRDGKVRVREQEGGRWTRIVDKAQLQLQSTKKRNIDTRSPQESSATSNTAAHGNLKKFALQGGNVSQQSQQQNNAARSSIPATPTKTQQQSSGTQGPRAFGLPNNK